jgi:foldase protein PrsA
VKLDETCWRFDTADSPFSAGEITLKKHLCLAAAGVLFASLAARGAAAQSDAAQPAAATQAPVVAQVGGVQVTLDQLQRPLVEGYGLNILLNLVQLQVARDNAARAGVKVTPQDLEQERAQTIERMFKESNEKLTDKINALLAKNQNDEAEKVRQQMRKDNDQAFEQFLQNQRITRAEFEIVTETNVNLRKIAEPMLAGKISDDNLKEAFNSLYGETVKCRHIQCSNLQEIQEAKRRLAAGQPFGKVAQEMSRNPGTAPLGGEIPTAFSKEMQGLPQGFRNAAFALKEGEVSDIVEADGAYHLILLEKRIPPKAVKFEDVKESLRADLMDRAVQATVKQLRQQLADQAVKGLVISDPIMKEQWEQRLAKRQNTIKDRTEIREQMQRERERAATQPAAAPAPDLAPAK